MMRKSSGEIVRALVLLSIAAGAISCAGAPRRDPVEGERDRLPKGLLVKVELDEELKNSYGSERAWAGTIVGVFRDELDLCERVWHEEHGHGATPREADMKMTIKISRAHLETAEVYGQGVFFELLAWVTIPLLPLWIDDVNVDPGLKVEVYLDNRGPVEISVDKKLTNLSDRYAFLSWQTLSVLLVPPFVHWEGDPEHLATSIADEVRREVAIKAGETVKAHRVDELMSNLDLQLTEADWKLSFVAGEDLSVVTLYVDDGPKLKPEVIPLHRGSRPEELTIPRAELDNAQYLIIKADGTDRSRKTYTLRIPTDQAPLTASAD